MRNLLFLIIALCIGCTGKGSRDELDIGIINKFINSCNNAFDKSDLYSYAFYDGENINLYCYIDLSEYEFVESYTNIDDDKDVFISGILSSIKPPVKDQIIDVLTRKNCHIILSFICAENLDLIAYIDISPQELSQ